MTTELHHARQSSTTTNRLRWTPYAAAGWAALFSLVSFYWAAGGTVGIGTLAQSIQRLGQERDPAFIVEVWITGVLKLLGAFLVLGLTRNWGGAFDRLVRILVWAGGALMLLYGASNFVQDVLIEVGVVGVPRSMGADQVRWYLFLWEPWWILGGLLFLGAAWSTRRRAERAG
jgi:hypothetical protein